MKLLNVVQLLLAVAAPVRGALNWKNVRIGGGGGFVPGIVFHPTEQGVAYARTDIGGLYRLNAADDSWTPITDSLVHHDKWGRFGVDAVALDPQDPDKVYAALGMYSNSWDPNNGVIVRSSDRGATWTVAELPFKAGGNMPGRGMGERLAVDPKNSKILFFGARSGNGLWKSTDGGATFSKVTSFTAVGTFVPDPSDAGGLNGDNQGLAFVTFDSTSNVVGGATSRIFVGTADKTTSLYVSEDAGATWKAMAGQPTGHLPHKGKLQPAEKALYVTFSDGSGPYDGDMGSVHRYDIAAGTFKDITPPVRDGLYHGFGGLGLDMKKPGTLVVASLNSWYPDAQLFRSTDSGATWTGIWEHGWPELIRYHGIYADKAPWIEAGFISADSKKLGWMIESLEIDPLDSDHWLYGTGLTVYGGHDLTKWDSGAGRNISVHVMADGIEEFAILEVASAPGGSELLAAVGDDSGFTFKTEADLDIAPRVPWMNPIVSTSTSVDFAGNKPDIVVRIGNGEGQPMAAISSDGGATWKVHPGTDSKLFGGEVAVSADGDIVLWATSTYGVRRSQGSGAFNTVSGLDAFGTVAVAADRRDNKLLYVGSTGNGKLFVSTDGGATFKQAAGSLGSAKEIRDIEPHPATEGIVYVSTDVGVFRSSDKGATFTPLDSALTNAHRIGLGLASADGSAWTLYAIGTGSAGARLYATDAAGGAAWEDVQGDAQGFGAIDICRVTGSGNLPGVVYVGTNGRGVHIGRGSNSHPPPATTAKPTSTTAKPPPATTSVPTTLTTKTSTTSGNPPATTGLPRYSQCGGGGWTGPTVCQAPYVCTAQNEWYSQCL